MNKDLKVRLASGIASKVEAAPSRKRAAAIARAAARLVAGRFILKDAHDLVGRGAVRTPGGAPVKIGPPNLFYNLRRTVWLTARTAPA
jgi:hypothetical protein